MLERGALPRERGRGHVLCSMGPIPCSFSRTPLCTLHTPTGMHTRAHTHTHTRAQPRACTHVHTHALSTHLHAHRSDSSPELVAVLTYLLAALQFSGKNECISLRLCIYYEQKASLKHGTVLLRPPCPVPGGLSVFVVWA